MMNEVRSTSPEETLALGRRLATLLEAGDVVLLAGKLGSGKTLLVAGVAEGLGIAGPVVSPSFVLVREYDDGFLPLVHADVYRLGSMAEFDDLELPDSAHAGVLLIEWGTAVSGSVPEDHLVIHIDVLDESERRFRFEAKGQWVTRPLGELA
jgi:tRNA threonylcarbamoyladenosine biosynthesis protein TsaE